MCYDLVAGRVVVGTLSSARAIARLVLIWTQGKGELMQFEVTTEETSSKQEALRYILEAWEEAVHDGIEPEMLANAALFAAFTDLISTYGEEAVAKMADGLSRRINHGEFTLNRVTQ